MRQPLPQTMEITIDTADLDAAIPHHSSHFACELCPVSKALMRSLQCAVALVGLEGAIVFRTAVPNPFRLTDDGHGARYAFGGPPLAELITAYDAGDFGRVRALLPFRFTVSRMVS